MKWLASNLTPLSILALVALVIFFASFLRLKKVDTNWRVFKLAGALLAILLFGITLGIVQVFRGPAGQIETVDEEGHVNPLPELPRTALERLRLDWDSSYVANWPAAETLADTGRNAVKLRHQ
jgi:hypothetical protein